MKKQHFTIQLSQVKRRVKWSFNPATRTIPSKKQYSRKNYKIDY